MNARSSCETWNVASTTRTGMLGMGPIGATNLAYERSVLTTDPAAARGKNRRAAEDYCLTDEEHKRWLVLQIVDSHCSLSQRARLDGCPDPTLNSVADLQ